MWRRPLLRLWPCRTEAAVLSAPHLSRVVAKTAFNSRAASSYSCLSAEDRSENALPALLFNGLVFLRSLTSVTLSSSQLLVAYSV